MPENRFDNDTHNAAYLEGNTFTNNNTFTEKWSDIILSALRSVGVFDNIIIQDTPPADTSMLWLDTRPHPDLPSVLRRYNGATLEWVPVTHSDIFFDPSNPTIRFSGQSTGDGTTTVFSLPADPASKANVDIYLNGIRQSDNQYTLSGTQVTFATAPSVGVDISFTVRAVFTTDADGNFATLLLNGAPVDVSRSTRSDAVTFISTYGAGLANGSKVSWGDGLAVVKVAGATAVSDMLGWLPFGDVYADHFAENVNPGTTDMTSAISAAVSYVQGIGGGIVNFMRSVYRISSTILVSGNGVRFVGQGQNNTIIRQSTSNTNAIRVASSEDGDTYNRFGGVFSLSIENLNADQTGGALLRLERARDFTVDDCRLLGGFYGIQNLSGNTVWISNTLINYQGFTATPAGESAGIHIGRLQTTASDPNGVQDPVDSLYYAVGFVCQISNVEVWGSGSYGRKHGLLIDQIDGLQVSNSHFGRAESGQVTIRAAQQNLIVQNINFSGCQFDPAGEVLTAGSDYGVWVARDGFTSRLVRDIGFSNCQVLGADVDGVFVDEWVVNFTWSGGLVKLTNEWGYRIIRGDQVNLIGATSRDTNLGAGTSGHVHVASTGTVNVIGVNGTGSAAALKAFEIVPGADATFVGCSSDGVGVTVDPSGIRSTFNGGGDYYGGIKVVSSSPYIRLFETDNTDDNFELILNSGGLNLNVIDQSDVFVSTPFRVDALARGNSITIKAEDSNQARVGINQNTANYPLDVLGDINSSTRLRIGGTQVVGSQGAAVTGPTGGATIDAESRTAINAIISRLQAHGLIA